jgi:hypothetical protein
MGIFGQGNAAPVQTYSAFGPGATTTGPEDVHAQPSAVPASDDYVNPESYYYSNRSKKLRFASKWYTCTQHDDKMFDFSGRFRQHEELWGSQPLIGQQPSFYVPLEQRRPHAPKRLARTITKRFTSLLFGQNRFPQLRSDDPATQDYAEELAKIGQLRVRMVQARNVGGSCGTVGISWCFYEGKPVNRVHDGSQIYTLQWANFDEKIPSHVMELYQLPMTGKNDKGELVEIQHWVRRDWTLNEDVCFKPTPVRNDGERVPWERDEPMCFSHNDARCHFVWITNDSEAKQASVDGEPDYEGQFEALDTLDVLNSVLARGGAKNLDPTLVLPGVTPAEMGAMVLMKGSDHALATGVTESNSPRDAKYLELSGSSITAGLELIKAQKNSILEDVQCVIPDPDEIAAAGTSSVAIKMIYAPMINVADVYREHYGDMGILRLLNDQIRSARRLLGKAQGAPLTPVTIEEDYALNEDPLPTYDVDTAAIPTEPEEPANDVEYFLDLEPRKEPVLDKDGNATDETRTIEREPGSGSLSLEWGEYFPPTIAERQQAMAGASTAIGAKPVASQQSMVESIANMMNRDPEKEWQRVQDEAARARDLEMGLTPPFGGAVPNPNELPPGATPPAGPVDPNAPAPTDIDVGPDGILPVGLADAEDGLVTPTDVAKIVTVNEARRSIKLGPLLTKDKRPDPDGDLTVAEYAAKKEAKGQAEGEGLGGALAPKPVAPPVPALPVQPKLPGI